MAPRRPRHPGRRYPCPNCNGAGGLPITIAFAGICTWCYGAKTLTEDEIRETKESKERYFEIGDEGKVKK